MTSLIDPDAVRVARVEIANVDSPDDTVRRVAIATLAHAIHQMRLADPASRHSCARLTHSNGGLIARYRTASPLRAATAGGAS